MPILLLLCEFILTIGNLLSKGPDAGFRIGNYFEEKAERLAIQKGR